MTDEELAIEYINGNKKALDELLRRTQTNIFAYIMVIVRDEETTNDLFQETYLKAITKLQQRLYSPTGKFSAWLLRIAHNVIMDWYRHQKVRSVVDACNDIDDAAQSQGQQTLHEISHEEAIMQAQILNDIKTMIKYLPKNQQEVVVMRYYQDYTFKEIAEMTGVSINTSLGRMRYALINMRKLAKEHNIQLHIV